MTLFAKWWRALLAWLFEPVAFPEADAAAVRALAEKGTVVYVMRSAAALTYWYVRWACERFGLPAPQAASELAFTPSLPHGADAVGAVGAGHPALVYLRRPRTPTARLAAESDPFPALVALQRRSDRPVYLVPQLLVWQRRPARLRRSFLDALFGDLEEPGFWRSLAFVLNRGRAFVKIGRAVDLQAVLAEEAGAADARLARKVRGVLHQHLARETRVVTGPPQKPAARIIEETLRDRTLRATLAEVARERGRADESVEREARRALVEIAARPSPGWLDLLRRVAGLVFRKIYDGIEIDEAGLRRAADAATHAPLVLCPSHKSHIDYMVLSYVFEDRGIQPPLIAAGANLSFWPLGPIFRRAGAFFIRRSFKGDRVYGAALKAYLKKLLRDGFTQEFFPEGTRSRTGKVLPPRYGILTWIVEAWLEGVRPDAFFVPIAINYEKLVEGSYEAELGGGEKKKEDIGALLRTPQVLRSRYGHIFIALDEPVSLAQLAAARGVAQGPCDDDTKKALVRALGHRIVYGINTATPLTSAGLLAAAMLSHERRGIGAPDVRGRIEFLLMAGREARALLAGAVAHAQTLDPLEEGPVREALRLFEDDDIVRVHEAAGEVIFSVPEEKRLNLDYYKNSILHFYVGPAITAAALETFDGPAPRAELQARALDLSRLLKREFIYRPGVRFEVVFAEALAALERWGVVRADGDTVAPAGRKRLDLLASLLRNFVESYLIAAAALEELVAGPRDAKDVVKHALERGRAAFYAGRILRAEALSRANLENAFALYEERGVLVRQGDKDELYALADPWRDRAKIAQLADEARRFL